MYLKHTQHPESMGENQFGRKSQITLSCGKWSTLTEFLILLLLDVRWILMLLLRGAALAEPINVSCITAWSTMCVLACVYPCVSVCMRVFKQSCALHHSFKHDTWTQRTTLHHCHMAPLSGAMQHFLFFTTVITFHLSTTRLQTEPDIHHVLAGRSDKRHPKHSLL